MRSTAIHSGLFLAVALVVCALVLWLRPEPPPVFSPTAQPQRIHVDPGTFDRYVGRYAADGGLMISIVRDGARLYAEIENGGSIELIPVSPRDFYAPAARATVRFLGSGERTEELRAYTERGALRAERVE